MKSPIANLFMALPLTAMIGAGVVQAEAFSEKLNNKYNSIVVDELMVKKGGDFKTVWSRKAEDEAFEYTHGGGTWF